MQTFLSYNNNLTNEYDRHKSISVLQIWINYAIYVHY